MRILDMEFFDTGDITLDEVLDEALRQCDAVEVWETFKNGNAALGMATDPTVDPARREVCWRYGLEVQGWITGLFQAAYARKHPKTRKAHEIRKAMREARKSGGKGCAVAAWAVV